MVPNAIRKQRRELEGYLRYRSPLIRTEAAEALNRARVGLAALREALETERDEGTLATLCEAMLLHSDRASVNLLKRLCEHPSWLVRKHAAWAVAELDEERSQTFLRRRLRSEKSRRVRTVLQAALFKWGDEKILDEFLRNLTSRDYLVRCIAANALGQNILRRDRRDVVLSALNEAVLQETTIAAREAIGNAIAAWQHPLRR